MRTKRSNRAPWRGLSLTWCLALLGCERDPSGEANVSAGDPASLEAPLASAPVAAPRGAISAAASGFGGEGNDAATPAAPKSPPSLSTAAAPIPRGKVPTSLTQNPPHVIKGDARGPIDVTEDGGWLRRMSYASITKATQNKGGSTVTIRLYFEDGYRAVLKADQKKSATNFRSEIVAYHLDRLLGCARTAPVVGRALPRAALRKLLVASGADQKFLERFDTELKEPEPDTVRGAVIAWHTKRLYSLDVPRAWPKWSPEQIPAAIKPQVSALEELTAFDYLLDNTDRWSGGNTLLLDQGGPLIFLDNGAGFADWRMQRKLALDADLEHVCSFPSELVKNLRAMGPRVPPAQRLGQRLARSLAKDPLAPILSPEHLAALDLRLERLLSHLDSCRK